MRRISLFVACLVALSGFLSSIWGAGVLASSQSGEPNLALVMQTDWDTVASSPVPTGRSAIGRIGDYVYVFGNQDNPELALCWKVSTETWVTMDPLPVPGYDWTGVVLGDELYVLGRYDGSHATRDFWKFTPDGTGGGSWTQLADYSDSLTMIAAGADEGNGLLYAAGGAAPGPTVSGDAHVYDVVSGTWQAIASLPEPRAGAGGAFLKGKFYVVGGVDSIFSYTNTLYEYDPDSDEWFEKAPLGYTVGFNWSCVTTNPHYLFLVGGGAGYGSWPARDYAWGYYLYDGSWEGLPSLPALHGTNSVVHVDMPTNPYILSTGGWDGNGFTGITYRLWVNYRDVALDSILSPPGAVMLGDSVSVSVVLSNYGTMFEDSVQIGYEIHQVADTTWDTTLIWVYDIQPNATGTVTFPDPWVPNTLGGWIMNTWTVLPGTPIDIDPTNDGLSMFGVTTGVSELTGSPVSQAFSLSQPRPNPFIHTATITYSVGSAVGGRQSAVSLRVYDVSGRLVRTLIDGVMPPGSHTVSWDGRDGSGADVPSGVYFCGLSAEGFQCAKRLIVLR